MFLLLLIYFSGLLGIWSALPQRRSWTELEPTEESFSNQMRGRRSFIRLFVGFILTATGVRPCPIELSSPSVVVKYGGPVSINCSTWDSQVTEMGWEATQGGTGLQEVKHLTWAVDNLTDWSISPLCYINMLQNSSVAQCEKMLKVVLYTFPENISISSDVDFNGGVFLLKENETGYFSCNINHVAPAHNLTVMWYEDNRLLYTENSQNSNKKPVDHLSILPYMMSRRQKNVKLRCEAHMDLGPEGPQLHVSSQEHELEVYFGPDVHCSHIALLEGESLESKCPVEGNPPPSVRWLRDGRLINQSLPLSREESGLYNIEAVGYSNITESVQVAVKYKPELTCPRSYSTTEHAPNSITCTVRGYPEPKITWLRDGEEVALPEELTRSDAGHYVVIASNEVSSVNVSLNIVIAYPPSQIDELEDYEVELGADVSLKCASVGNPRSEYLWTYYRAANVKELSEDGVSRLLVHNVTAHNVGSYTCHATNDYGHVSKTAALTVRGVTKECPLEIRPNRMAIQYQSHNPNVDCVVTSNDPRNIVNVSWEAATIRIIGKTWRVDTSRDWDLRPSCTASFLGIGTCQKSLDYTLYKTPDEVFLSSDVSLVVEDRPFQLRCDIINVAPARSLVVRWYQGNDIFETHVKGSLKMMDCPSENITSCNIGMVSSPVNVSSAISVTLNRTHRGEQFRCDVELNLEFEKPLPPLVMTSNPVTITVLSKPAINTTKLPKTIPVFRGYPEELVCEADGHPPPKIQWSYRSLNVSNNTITAVEAGLYNCTATNEVDSTFYVVEVVLKEDYLPLIAGFVAVTVVAISVVFLFIYSIYYKNTKMRRYSLKNPKLGNHNGNVAHNGWDLQFPMTKLS